MAETVQLVRGKSLEIFRTCSNGLSARESIMKVGEAGRVIASNLRTDKALAGEERGLISDAFSCWTGTMAAYVEPGKAFNKSRMFSNELQSAVFTDPRTGERWIFPVKEYGSEKDAILVSEHPDYTIEVNGNEILIKPSIIDIVPNFPEKDGWYLIDPKHGITFGEEISSDNPEARYLWRAGGSGRVSRVIRGRDNLLYGWKYVDIYYWPSDVYGVVVEAPERGAAV